MSLFSPLRLAVKTLDVLSSKLPRALVRVPVNDTGAPISPLLHWLLHLRRLKNGTADLIAETPEKARRDYRNDVLPLRKGYPVRAVRDLTIPGPAGLLKARHYRPAAEGELPALLVFLHGGGFMIGDLDTHDDICRLLCREAGLQVLSVDYRLAPEHPFPAGVDDAEAAVRWAQANAAQFGVAPTAIAVGGDSAGGNLSAVVAQRLANSAATAGIPLLAQLLAYPTTDASTLRDSHRHFAEGFFLSIRDRDWFFHHYLGGDEALQHDAGFSPLLNTAPGVLAPALLITAGFDILRDEGEAYGEHLRAHGTAVEHIRFEQLGHGFLNFVGVHRDSELAQIRLARQFRLLCSRALATDTAPTPPAAGQSAAPARKARPSAANAKTPRSKKSTPV